ncbi:MAG: type II CRISPR-associated endonuclease Cas1 [Hyphomicrobiales bacterium]|nr:type II CRISPR-associated endonuclease Cas1 [Hyphomicrobiales bacterium]
MQNRVVEISSDGAFVSVSRGFLVVSIEGQETGQVAIDDMCALIIRGHGSSLSINICSRLAKANIPVVICQSNQSPASVIWPVSGHFSQGLQMQAQAVANKPLLNRLWAQLIKAKIDAQAFVLANHDINSNDIQEMTARVKSGDRDNLEAQAARRYWPRLLGKEFRRDRQTDNINGALNYGYTILRAGVARSILAAGLHPSLAIHHQSRGDALRLADDLMEPFRPWVDNIVKQLSDEIGAKTEFVMEKDHKARLVAVLSMDLQTKRGASAIQTCMDRMAQSLVQVFLGEEKNLELPQNPLPLVLVAGK